MSILILCRRPDPPLRDVCRRLRPDRPDRPDPTVLIGCHPDRRPDRPDPAICGTRRAYRLGCRCVACRSASARTRQAQRTRQAHGTRSLDTRIDRAEAFALWRQLRRELPGRIIGFRLRRRSQHVTQRTLLKLRRLTRLYLSPALDVGCRQAGDTDSDHVIGKRT